MPASRRFRAFTATSALIGVATLSLASVGTAQAGINGATSTTRTSTRPAPIRATATMAPEGAVADDRLLVTMDPGTTDAAAAAIAAAVGATLETRAGDTLILDPLGGFAANSATLGSLPGVQNVETNGVLQSFASSNDPLLPEQYGLLDNQPGGTRAETAWNGTRGSRDVVVGVLDSGIAPTHPDLRANLWVNRTRINGCGYGTIGYDAFTGGCAPFDDAGHGTHVAGIVGAVGNNGIGVSGVAQRVSMMSLRMLRYDPVARRATGTEADALAAIDFALDAKAAGVNLRVLQASWGTSDRSTALSLSVQRANDAGVLFVAAAGNGDSLESPPLDLDIPGSDIYPCEDASPNVVCVAASTEFGTLASFSNYGAVAVDLAAPGDQIYSTVPRGLVAECGTNAEYCAFYGTSMAAPMVSGAAADVLAAEPDISMASLKARILASTDTLAALTGKVATGGRLNVCKALPNCDGQPAVAPTKPTAVRARAQDGAAKLSWGTPDSNGNSFLISGFEVEGPAGVTSLDFNARSFTVTGLTNNQNAVIRVRAFGSGGIGPWVTKTVRPHVGGYLVDGLGAIHRIGVNGQLPSAPSGGLSFPSDLARGIAVIPEGTGGYVVDAYGGLHRFRIGATSPLPPIPTGGPYWLGWDIVRGVAVSENGGGYVVDGYGGLHPFGAGEGAPPGGPSGGPYWSGWDIARGVTFTEGGTGGYVVDGYGGIHRFRIGGNSLPASVTGGPYWLGWNIVRGIALVPGSGGGWVLDGYGGLHRFAAGGTTPPPPSSGPYWLGQDIARGVSL